MFEFIVKRLLMALLTMWIVSVLAFIIIQLPPGDYVTSYVMQLLAQGTVIDVQQAAALRDQYGLNDPIWIQYVKWIARVLQGDFGVSMEWQRPVADLIGERLVLTVVVSLSAIVFAWIVAIPVGIYSAVNQYSVGDNIFTFLGFLGLAIPDFLLALLVLFLGYEFFGLNLGGLISPEFERAPWSAAKIMDLLSHLWLPTLILGTSGMAAQLRVMRANLLDELRKPYVVTARAKGLRESHLILKYPVRAALNPLVSTIGYLLPHVVSGSIIVGLVLALPNVGPLLLGSLLSQDMYLAGAIILLLGVLTVIGTFLSDLLLLWVEPRLRFPRTA
jgi:peptide/nickel transport system permease protein